MTEEIAQQSEAPAVADEPQTLDDVISTFNVKPPEPQQPAATPIAQESTPAQPVVPDIDPYDPDSLNKWAAQTAQQTAALQSELQNLRADADARARAEAKQIIDADIKSAVGKITETVDGIDPLMAELYLNKRAEEKPEFKQIWENRHKDPVAYDAALGAISNELQGKFQRVDPQLAENHRAAQQSTQSNQTAKTTEYNNSYEERLASAKNEQERAMIWAQIKNGG